MFCCGRGCEGTDWLVQLPISVWLGACLFVFPYVMYGIGIKYLIDHDSLASAPQQTRPLLEAHPWPAVMSCAWRRTQEGSRPSPDGGGR